MGNPDIANELQRIDEKKQKESVESDVPLV
jgi:hypothetical protein